MKNRYNIVIGGYYGFGSLGDEAVLYSILSGIAKRLPGSRVTVLSRNPCSIPKISGIETAFKSRTNPLSVVSALLAADLYISGGGSLLQDATSKRSLSYYCALLHLARLFRCKIFIYANGIGPVKSEKICKRALLTADIISVRDPDSLALCQRLCEKKASPILSADPIFANTFSSKMPPFFDEKLPKKPYFLVSLRSIRGENSVDLEKLSKVLRRLSREGFLPVFVSMQDSFDLEISRRAARLTDGISVQIKDAEELYFLLGKASFAIGMRLHFLLTAAIAGTPFVPLSYDPKIEGCLRALGASPSVSAFDFSEEELFSLIKNQRESFSKSDTEAACRRLRMLAEGDFDAVVSLLRSKESTAEKFYADT